MYFVAELHSPISSVPRITITSVGSILPASCLSMAAPAITWQITSGQQWFCLLLMQEQKPVTTALVTCSLTNKAHHIDHVGCLASQTWMWWSQEKERKRKGWRWACKQHIHFFYRIRIVLFPTDTRQKPGRRMCASITKKCDNCGSSRWSAWMK